MTIPVHPKLERARELAKAKGAGMVVKESNDEFVTVYYCNSTHCCEMTVPREEWDDAEIRKLWDEVQKKDYHASR